MPQRLIRKQSRSEQQASAEQGERERVVRGSRQRHQLRGRSRQEGRRPEPQELPRGEAFDFGRFKQNFNFLKS